jgi:uncharacterized damage-inducible protein DinB
MTPETCLGQLETCYALVKANASGISHDASLRHPEPAGNSLNWVLGHLVATRSDLLNALGADPVWGPEERKAYERHGPPLRDASKARPLAEIWTAYDLSQQRLRTAIAALTPEQLAAKAAFSPAKNPNETVGSLLGVFAFHDAYHTGQTGVLRRVAGWPPADL